MRIALATISDTRTSETDTSGASLRQYAESAGHQIADQQIIADDLKSIQTQVQNWIADNSIDVVITTGGTGFTQRDVTPEAITPLFTKSMPGFGEMFRVLSYAEIGTSTLQSRVCAGLAERTWVFVLPGSSGACRLGWEKLIGPQLDADTKPCNLAMLAERL